MAEAEADEAGYLRPTPIEDLAGWLEALRSGVPANLRPAAEGGRAAVVRAGRPEVPMPDGTEDGAAAND